MTRSLNMIAFTLQGGFLTTLIFQQLFEPMTSTYTYLLADARTREAILIDPVKEMLDRDLRLIQELDLKLRYVLDTHLHADHITASGPICDKIGAKVAIGAEAKVKGADRSLEDGDILTFGQLKLAALATPGHTHSCMCFHVHDRVFTGDTLLIRGNGRTDFQQGSPERLYQSIHEKLFQLPDETLVFPGHDYCGFTSSTIGAEKKWNKRIGGGRSLAEFVNIMKDLKLEPPKKIDEAVPANQNCGRI